MLKQVLQIFNIEVDYDLNVMEDRQTLTKITVKVLNGMKEIFKNDLPHLTLVHGDTTTTFTSALASFTRRFQSDMWKQVYELIINMPPFLKK